MLTSSQPRLKQKSDWLDTQGMLSMISPTVKTFNVRILQPRQSAPDYLMKGICKDGAKATQSKSRLSCLVRNRQLTDDCEKSNNLFVQNPPANTGKQVRMSLYDRRLSRLTDDPVGLVIQRPSGLWRHRQSKKPTDCVNEKGINDYKLNAILCVNQNEGNDENFNLSQHYKQSDQNSISMFSKHLSKRHCRSILTHKRAPNFDEAFNSEFNKNLANLTSTKFFRKTETKRFFDDKSKQHSSKAMLTTVTMMRKESTIKLFSNVIHLAIIKFDQNKVDGGFDCAVISEDLQNRTHFGLDTLTKLQLKLNLDSSCKYYYDAAGDAIGPCMFCKSGCTCLAFLADYIYRCIETQQSKMLFIVSKMNVRNIFDFAITTNNGGNFKKRCFFFSQLFLKPPAIKPVQRDFSGVFPQKKVYPFRNYCSNPPSKHDNGSQSNLTQLTSQNKNLGGKYGQTDINFFDHNRENKQGNLNYQSQKGFQKIEGADNVDQSQLMRKTFSSQFLRPKFSMNVLVLPKTDARKIASNLLEAYFKSPYGTSSDLKELLELIRKSDSSKQLNKTVKTIIKKDLNATKKVGEIRQNYLASENPLQENPQMNNLFKLNQHYVQMLSTYLSKEIDSSPLVNPNDVDNESEINPEEQILSLLESLVQEISTKESTNVPHNQRKTLLKRILNKRDIESQPDFIKNNITYSN